MSKSDQMLLMSKVWPKELFKSATIFSTRSSRGFAIPFVTVHFKDNKMQVTVFGDSGKSAERASRLPINRSDFVELLCELSSRELIGKALRFEYRSFKNIIA